MSQPYMGSPDTSPRKPADKGDLVERIDAALARSNDNAGYEAFVLFRKYWPELKAQRTQLASARKALAAIEAGYGSHHQSRFCDRIARAALKDLPK